MDFNFTIILDSILNLKHELKLSFSFDLKVKLTKNIIFYSNFYNNMFHYYITWFLFIKKMFNSKKSEKGFFLWKIFYVLLN